MKNPNQRLRTEEFHAQKAVQQIQKWVEERYPRLTISTKTRILIECLIELSEERKFLASLN
jgi:hypothetical protein